MPYASDKQRRFLHARHPEIASEWDAEIRAKKRRRRQDVAKMSLSEITKLYSEYKVLDQGTPDRTVPRKKALGLIARKPRVVRGTRPLVEYRDDDGNKQVYRAGGELASSRRVKQFTIGKSLSEIAKAVEQEQPKERKRLISGKLRQKRFSEAGAVLGLTALGATAPKAARHIASRFPKVAHSKPLKALARLEPKANALTAAATPLSLGVGAMGSINFARQQGLEAKAEQRKPVAKEDIHGWMPAIVRAQGQNKRTPAETHAELTRIRAQNATDKVPHRVRYEYESGGKRRKGNYGPVMPKRHAEWMVNGKHSPFEQHDWITEKHGPDAILHDVWHEPHKPRRRKPVAKEHRVEQSLSELRKSIVHVSASKKRKVKGKGGVGNITEFKVKAKAEKGKAHGGKVGLEDDKSLVALREARPPKLNAERLRSVSHREVLPYSATPVRKGYIQRSRERSRNRKQAFKDWNAQAETTNNLIGDLDRHRASGAKTRFRPLTEPERAAVVAHGAKVGHHKTEGWGMYSADWPDVTRVSKDRFTRKYGQNISEGAENAYVDLGQRKRRRYGDVAAYGTLAAAPTALGGFNLAAAARGRSFDKVPEALSRSRRLGATRIGLPLTAVGAGLGYAGVRRAQEGRSLQQRRNKIKAKGYERHEQGLLGRDRKPIPLKGVNKAFGISPRFRPMNPIMPIKPRVGGLMRTASGRTVTRRGAIVGTSRPRRSF
jgi:hypothetical protein